MPTPRKKVTTTTTATTIEEYDTTENDGSSTVDQIPDQQLILQNRTGDISIDEQPGTSSKKVNGDSNQQFGRTWVDGIVFFMSGDFKVLPHIFLLLIYSGSFIAILTFFHSCELLNSYNWIWRSLVIGTTLSAIYLFCLTVMLLYKKFVR